MIESKSGKENPAASQLTSGVVTSPADAMLGQAVARTLAESPESRAHLFAELVREIEDFMAAHPQERPWTCRIYAGTDGSCIFRGGVGHSLVVDTAGRLWRARSYEDFVTTYAFGNGTCEIDKLTPLYSQMREYLPRRPI
ncbi:MAG TPA: hypothetical protein VE086_02030 [Chthoniobacterales bacterium]|nr:hypothetical protein [Chthoniobacterales bacterium]